MGAEAEPMNFSISSPAWQPWCPHARASCSQNQLPNTGSSPVSTVRRTSAVRRVRHLAMMRVPGSDGALDGLSRFSRVATRDPLAVVRPAFVSVPQDHRGAGRRAVAQGEADDVCSEPWVATKVVSRRLEAARSLHSKHTRSPSSPLSTCTIQPRKYSSIALRLAPYAWSR